MKIIKKCNKKYFELVQSGEKKFDVRLADFEVKKGDTMILKESINGKETGRDIEKKISFVLKTKDLHYWSNEEINKFGHVIIQLD